MPNFELNQEKIDARFSNISKQPHLPESLLAIIKKILELEAEALPELNIQFSDELKEKLASPAARLQGVPLLSKEYFPIDRKNATAIAEKLLNCLPELVNESDNSLAESAHKLRKMIDNKELNWNEAFDAILTDDMEFFKLWAERIPNAPSLVRFLALSGATPSIHKIKILLNEILEPKDGKREAVWPHGHCPACGTMPFMGRLHTKEGQRYHSCSFCQYEYRVGRIQCPFCLNDDAETLLHYTAEEEPMYQLHVCKACKNYIKVSDYRQSFNDYVASLDDLESITLDLLAKRMGYTRPTLSVWGF